MPIQAAEYCNVVAKEACTGAFWRDVFGELLATFFLVSVQCALPLYWGPTNSGDVLQTGLGMAFVVIAIGWGWGDFGGAHMNPAVTMALTVRGEITFLRAVFYWVVQCGGAIAGAFFVYAITPESVRGNVGATFLDDGIENWQGFLIEFWISLVLVIAVIGSLNRLRKKELYMFVIPIGLAIALGHFVAFTSTKASMNPARSLGPAVVVSVMGIKDDIWDDHWVYWAGPLGAAIVGAVIYMLFDRVDAPDAQPKPDMTYVQGSSGYSASNPKMADRVLLNTPSQADTMYNINGVAQRNTMNMGTSAYPARYW